MTAAMRGAEDGHSLPEATSSAAALTGRREVITLCGLSTTLTRGLAKVESLYLASGARSESSGSGKTGGQKRSGRRAIAVFETRRCHCRGRDRMTMRLGLFSGR